MNENILYLVHMTDNNITKCLRKSTEDDQFPGVYFSLITKYNLKYETLFPAKNCLIFSKQLLEQQNYHINFVDYNGFINESNTYFPWELDKVIKKLKSHKGYFTNEVVFHDNISLDYLCLKITLNDISSNITNLNELILPKYEMYNNTKINKNILPFYCYAKENEYTGINPKKLSSISFYKKMAIMCNIDAKLSRDEIIEKINEKIDELNNNREKQKLKAFKFLLETDKTKSRSSTKIRTI
tara:strand:- start:104 stop:826 length:723 start_codon:yes stop_codon:yes gene_type:complete